MLQGMGMPNGYASLGQPKPAVQGIGIPQWKTLVRIDFKPRKLQPFDSVNEQL